METRFRVRESNHHIVHDKAGGLLFRRFPHVLMGMRSGRETNKLFTLGSGKQNGSAVRRGCLGGVAEKKVGKMGRRCRKSWAACRKQTDVTQINCLLLLVVVVYLFTRRFCTSSRWPVHPFVALPGTRIRPAGKVNLNTRQKEKKAAFFGLSVHSQTLRALDAP